jgi:hypothetical protein
MVQWKININKTRKLKRVGSGYNPNGDIISAVVQKQSEIKNSNATLLPTTTLVTAGIGEAALSVGYWIGGGALRCIDSGLAAPLVTIVTATMEVARTTYSVARKNKLKNRIRHFIKKQIFATLDEMNDKSKGKGLSAIKYPPLEHYETDKANVRQFFIEYGIFTRLADIFMSMQSSMLHFYPSERLMFPIHFINSPDDGPKNIDFKANPYSKYPVGTNFVCFYNYLTSNEELHFTCDQLNDGTNTSYLRFKLDSEIWVSKTPEQIVNIIKLLLTEGNLADYTEYMPSDSDVSTTNPEKKQLTETTTDQSQSEEIAMAEVSPLVAGRIVAGPSGVDGKPVVGIPINIKQHATVSPDVSDKIFTGRSGVDGEKTIYIELPALPILDNTPINQTFENQPSKERFPIIRARIKIMMEKNILDYMKVNNTDNRKFTVGINDTNMSDIETEFAKHVVSLLQLQPFVKIIVEQLKEFKTSYLKDYNDEADEEEDEAQYLDPPPSVTSDNGVTESGGRIFAPTMSASGNTIKGSNDKMFQSIRTKNYSTQDKHSFIEFLYYSTYSFYRVFSKILRVRESEMIKFFNYYVGDLMDMLKNNFSVIVNNSSIYISIARALEVTFERKLGVAFASSGSSSTNNVVDYNSNSSLNETGAIEYRLKKANLFSTDLFFNLKNKKIIDYIFKTYGNIQSLEKAMDDSSLGNRQRNVAGQLDSRFTREILGKNPAQEELIESHLVRNSLNSIFNGKFGMFKNILEHIDDAIDDFDGVSTLEFQTKLQTQLPKLANIGREGITFSFGDGLLEMGRDNDDLIDQQIYLKEQELDKLQKKKTAIAKIKTGV